MFEKENTVFLITSASAVNNNLVVRNENEVSTVAVIHEGYVNVVRLKSTAQERDKYIPCVAAGTKPKRVTTVVTQVMWCKLNDFEYFIIASTLGIQLFDGDGCCVVYSHPCIDSSQHPIAYFARGLAVLGEDLLFAGNSSGSIWVFRIPGKRENEVELVETRIAHPKAISTLGTSKSANLIASADDSGSVILWKFVTKLQRVAAFENYGTPCTSLHLWNDAIICGYGSGHIRCFDLNKGHIIVEIGAHARNITALDISEEKGFILSVSEDSFAKVWQINQRNYHVEHVATMCVENSFLVGGQFLNSNGSEFCVSIYDSNEVHCYCLLE